MAGGRIAGDVPYYRPVGVSPRVYHTYVILFGSLARGNVGSTSDIDLIVVEDTDKRFLDRPAEVYAAVVPRKGLDVLVYTPEEFEAMSQCSSLVRKAVSNGKRHNLACFLLWPHECLTSSATGYRVQQEVSQ